MIYLHVFIKLNEFMLNFIYFDFIFHFIYCKNNLQNVSFSLFCICFVGVLNAFYPGQGGVTDTACSDWLSVGKVRFDNLGVV